MDATKIILTVISSLLAPIVSLLIWMAKSKRKEKLEHERKMREMERRDEELKELCNYIAGSVDVLIQDTIKVTPEIRDNFKQFSERYHSLDLVPFKKEEK